MAHAEYLVTQHPGVQLPTGGSILETPVSARSRFTSFVEPGEVFSAPAGFVPSLRLFPVNAEAAIELGKAFETGRKILEERVALSSGVDRVKLRSELEDLNGRQRRASTVVTPAEIGEFHSKGATHFRRTP